jgi:DNA-binding SARP family transcriptional activator
MARLRLLGGAAIERASGTATGPLDARRHPLALLALLACTPGRTLSRAKLAGLLWPDRPEAAARNRLNSCLYNIRRDLGADAVLTSGEDVRLGPAITCDVIEFHESLEADERARAAELYAGPLLDGFYLRDTPEFEKWLDVRRESLRRRYHECLEVLARHALEAGRPEAAARHWRTLATEDPFDARSAARLVEALEAADNPGAALRAGEAHVRAMAEEFGREPRAEFLELLERIRRGDPPPGGAAAAGASGAGAATSSAAPPGEAQLRYVQGRGHLGERTEAGLRLAVNHFRAAIDLHEDYAAAWAGLADALDMLRFYDYAPPEDAPTPLAAARRALEIDAESGEGWAALGIGHSLRQQGPEAVEALERAIELRPSHGEAYIWLAWVRLLTGHPDDALAVGRRAIEIDPLSPAYRAYLAEIWLANGELERASIEARRAVEIQPSYGLARYMLAVVEYHRDDRPAARSALGGTAAAVPSGGTPRHAEIRALEALCRVDDEREAAIRGCLAALDAAPGPARDAGSVGLLRAALGDVDAAFEAFEDVRVWRDFSVETVRYFFPAELGPLRADPRYPGLIAAIDDAWSVG